mmetsp:Transcript_28446/g.93510  ORF Transcript_28446/g.93510 Transcript_28446/m.93510 type:complete len:286 (+) Transcript_28446:149-1006(+)
MLLPPGHPATLGVCFHQLALVHALRRIPRLGRGVPAASSLLGILLLRVRARDRRIDNKGRRPARACNRLLQRLRSFLAAAEAAQRMRARGVPVGHRRIDGDGDVRRGERLPKLFFRQRQDRRLHVKRPRRLSPARVAAAEVVKPPGRQRETHRALGVEKCANEAGEVVPAAAPAAAQWVRVLRREDIGVEFLRDRRHALPAVAVDPLQNRRVVAFVASRAVARSLVPVRHRLNFSYARAGPLFARPPACRSLAANLEICTLDGCAPCFAAILSVTTCPSHPRGGV